MRPIPLDFYDKKVTNYGIFIILPCIFTHDMRVVSENNQGLLISRTFNINITYKSTLDVN